MVISSNSERVPLIVPHTRSAGTNDPANIPATSHREQKIPGLPLFAGDRSKARAWLMDVRLKLTADTQLFRTGQANTIYISTAV